MFHLNYQFPEDPDLGEWKVVVLYGNDLRQKLEQKFELQEYVLPTFRVDIDITDTLVPSMNSTSAKITATHVYGKPVQGQVFVKEFIETVIGNPTHCKFFFFLLETLIDIWHSERIDVHPNNIACPELAYWRWEIKFGRKIKSNKQFYLS